MKSIRWLNILSLDVTAGAVICSVFLSRMWGVIIQPLDLILLADAVWLIYTFDHLKDAYDIRNRSSTYRHRFHYHNFKPLLVICLLCIVSGLIVLLWVDEMILRLGCVLVGLVGSYFLALHFLPTQARYHKEIVIALLYALGVGLSPLAIQYGRIEWIHGWHIFQLFLLALGNLLLFSWFERDKDRKSGFPSMIQSWLRNNPGRKIRLFMILQCGLSLLLFFFTGYFWLQFTYFLMAGLMLTMSFSQKSLSIDERYRLIGDAVFLLPVVTLFLV